jgi:hypothetical protein
LHEELATCPWVYLPDHKYVLFCMALEGMEHLPDQFQAKRASDSSPSRGLDCSQLQCFSLKGLIKSKNWSKFTSLLFHSEGLLQYLKRMESCLISEGLLLVSQMGLHAELEQLPQECAQNEKLPILVDAGHGISPIDTGPKQAP